MLAMAIQDAYGIDNLKPLERDVPKPGPGQVLIKMKAASLNYRDLATVKSEFGGAYPLPLVPLSDGAGEVIEVGEGVRRVAVGDQVAPNFFQGWFSGKPTPAMLGATALGGPIDGCAQEYMCLSAEGVTKAPKGYTPEETASLPCAALTAWRAIVTEGQVKPGDTVLVQGTGGVSIFALQFAKAAGATVIATSSSDEKLERVKALGADMTINYKATPDWATEARKLTGGEGVDHIVEVGGAETFQQSIMAAKLGGHIGVIGILSGVMKDLNVAAIFSQNLHITGITVGSRAFFEDMVKAIEANDIHPVIDKTFPLTEAQEALRLMDRGGHFGKIVLDIA